jgi:tRNA/rRNA methyltransferase
MERNACRMRVVLVGPKDSRNVGSVCRAMKTMGFQNLYLVGGKNIDREEAGITAVHAGDVLDRAVRCSKLEEALEDVVLAAGVSRRQGKRRKYFSLSPEQLAERIASLQSGTCALVFGNESSGLSDGELILCHLAVRIPSSPGFPSLNLSHAVQLICYQIFRRLSPREINRTFRPISDDRLRSLCSEIVKSLGNIGFFTQGDAEELAVFWRDILARAALDRREAQRLARIFAKISGMVTGRGICP